jgi:hypothetical protein
LPLLSFFPRFADQDVVLGALQQYSLRLVTLTQKLSEKDAEIERGYEFRKVQRVKKQNDGG